MKTILAMMLTCVTLTAGVRAQVPDFTPQTPLIGALLHNDLTLARQLIVQGADPNDGRFAGLAPVFLAIQRQDVALVRLMIDHGADLQARDASGSTTLMWAAFNERGDATLVEELLTRGVDALVTNKVGESALDWALRRGETAAVATLRRAGASNALRVRAAVEKALALVQRSGSQFAHSSPCYSCHHQALPQLAFAVARSHGVAVDEAAAADGIQRIEAVLGSVYQEALKNRDRTPDPPIAASYGLLALAAAHHAPDEMTSAMTRVIGAWQGEDGAFHALPTIRPPLESSDVTATALSIRALQLYGSRPDAQVARARAWLRHARPYSTEEHAMQLLGLTWANAPAADIRKSAEALVVLQRRDGGWSQLPALETDAYATGQALVALQAAGCATSSDVWQRGASYLIRTQFPDGSWLVRTRTYPVQPPKDTGFPHGRNQWISAAGTSWAAMALALSLPAPEEK